MPDSDTGERVTTVLDFPSRDGLVRQRRSAWTTSRAGSRAGLTDTRPAHMCTSIDGSVIFGIDEASRSCSRRATRSMSRRARSTPCRAMPARSSRRA